MNTKLAKKIIAAYENTSNFKEFNPFMILTGKDKYIDIYNDALRAIELNAEKENIRKLFLNSYSRAEINDFLHRIKYVSGYWRGRPSRIMVENKYTKELNELFLF